MSPRSFICPCTKQQEFDGKNPANRDIVNLWDFGPDPHKHVSYTMHNPYGRFPSGATRSASFVIAADASPYFENGNIFQKPQDTELQKKHDSSDLFRTLIYNTPYHQGEGQNVLYADGHSAWEKQSDVGTHNDNIYTYWSTDKEPSKQDIQVGTAPTERTAENDAKSKEDSFLAI